MGKDLYETFPIARELYDQAVNILGFDLRSLSFEGPEEELKQTYITQPAIFVHSVIVNRLLDQRGISPHIVAGHSLGEYSALVAAGVLDFESGLRLVKLRGELMQRAGEENPGTMAAIIGLNPLEVEDLCREASEVGVVCAANFNSPEQVAISGSIEGVHRAMELARARGAKRVVELVVSGAFHSPLMKGAEERLGQALEQTAFHDPRMPVVPNVTASPTTRSEEIRQNLLRQLTHPVRWVESIQKMITFGAHQFLEVGPGRVLTGLLRRINREVQGIPVGTLEDLNRL